MERKKKKKNKKTSNPEKEKAYIERGSILP